MKTTASTAFRVSGGNPSKGNSDCCLALDACSDAALKYFSNSGAGAVIEKLFATSGPAMKPARRNISTTENASCSTAGFKITCAEMFFIFWLLILKRAFYPIYILCVFT